MGSPSWVKGYIVVIYKMKYYSAIKNNKLLIPATTWIYLKVIVMSEKSLFPNTILYNCINITFSKRYNHI